MPRRRTRLRLIDHVVAITGILMLNMCLILPLMTSSINGLDSSLVNGTRLIIARLPLQMRTGDLSACGVVVL